MAQFPQNMADIVEAWKMHAARAQEQALRSAQEAARTRGIGPLAVEKYVQAAKDADVYASAVADTQPDIAHIWRGYAEQARAFVAGRLSVDQEKQRWLTGDATSESPIEKLLFEAFVRQAVRDPEPTVPPVGWAPQWNTPDVFAIRGRSFTVRPQFDVFTGKYRLDFALFSGCARAAVEIDGHDWHERTKEQAARDKRRDRELQIAGWFVLRFTGSEVFGDADACVTEVMSFIRERDGK